MPGAIGPLFQFERCKRCNIYYNNLYHETCGTCHLLVSCDKCKKYLEPFIMQKRFEGTLLGSMYIGTDLWSIITKIIPVMYNCFNFDFVYPGLYWKEKHSDILLELCNKPSKKRISKKFFVQKK